MLNEAVSSPHFSPVSGSPAPGVVWLREGQPVRPRPGLSLQQQGSTHSLSLEGLTRREAGTYSCALTSPSGQVSSSWTLTVKSKHRHRFQTFSHPLAERNNDILGPWRCLNIRLGFVSCGPWLSRCLTGMQEWLSFWP